MSNVNNQDLVGFIIGNNEDEKVLTDMGVIVGTYDLIEGLWHNCVVSPTAMQKLEPTWMKKFVWGLR